MLKTTEPTLADLSRNTEALLCQLGKQLFDTQEKYKDWIDNLAVGVFRNMPGQAGRILEANPAMIKMFEANSKKDLLSRNISQLYKHPSKYKEISDKILKDSTIKNEEVQLKTLKGTSFWASVTAVLSRDREGNIFFDGIIEDISERKRIEKALKDSKEQYRMTINSINAAIHVVDSNLRFILFNSCFKKWCRRLGLQTDVIGKTIFDVFRFLPAKVISEYRYVFRNGKIFTSEERNRVKGREIITETQKIPVFEEKKVIRVVTVIRDITDRKKADIALRQSEQEFRLAFENAKDAILWADAKTGIIIKCNRAAEQLLERKKEDIIGKSQAFLHPPQKLKYYSRMFKKHIKSKRAIDEEAEVITQSGQIKPVYITASTTRVAGRLVIQGSFRDISERKRINQELRYRVKFEELITRLSTKFINISLKNIDREINKALGEIGCFAGVDRSYIFLEQENGNKVCNTHEWCSEGIEPQIEKLKSLDVRDFPWFAKKIRRREIIHVPFLDDLPAQAKATKELLAKESVKSIICVPMVYGKSVVGFLGFDSVRKEKKWKKEIIILLKIAGDMFVNALEHKRDRTKLNLLNKALSKSNVRLKQSALIDATTGLYNHRYFSEHIEIEFHRARRYNASLSVIMLDLDYFKSVNDIYGHEFGDLVLIQLARLLKKTVRTYDIVTRFGGEEFVIISPGIDRNSALNLAQRLLNVVNLYNFGNFNHKVKLKLSIAVASYPEDNVIKGINLIELNERILHKAKELGGNRVFSSLDIKEEKQITFAPEEEYDNVIFLRDKIHKLTKRTNESLIEAIFAFAKAIELKDHYTGEHVERTVEYSIGIAKALGLPKEETEYIRQASILHDLGKIGISEKILKKRSKLSPKEILEIRKHPQIAADILRPIHFLHSIIPLILYHHARWDGRGYPHGLKGDEIPVGARIVAIADVYQALISDRPYRKAFSKYQAIKIIKRGSGTQFDPNIVNVFINILKRE